MSGTIRLVAIPTLPPSEAFVLLANGTAYAASFAEADRLAATGHVEEVPWPQLSDAEKVLACNCRRHVSATARRRLADAA